MDEKNILLVTGASSEIGAALIRQVGKNYKKIWAHYCNSVSVVEMLRQEAGDGIIPIQADFSDLESTKDFINCIANSGDKPNHIVYLSAQKPHGLQFHKQQWESYQKEIEISLRSAMMISRAFIPAMVKEKYGKIVFMLSAYLLGIPPKFQSPYITAKYAMLGLMHCLAAEYATKGIMVNAVSPDMMETKFLSELPELVKQQSAQNNPLGRNLCVEEVVPTVEYLLSRASDVVTGQNIGVTSGREIH